MIGSAATHAMRITSLAARASGAPGGGGSIAARGRDVGPRRPRLSRVGSAGGVPMVL
jgi:hypothetical protein